MESNLLDQVLVRLLAMRVPLSMALSTCLAEPVAFQVHESLSVLRYVRRLPEVLRVLFSSLSLDTVLWTLSLLLCETKLIVVAL